MIYRKIKNQKDSLQELKESFKQSRKLAIATEILALIVIALDLLFFEDNSLSIGLFVLTSVLLLPMILIIENAIRKFDTKYIWFEE